MSELKPCPCCGSTDIRTFQSVEAWVECHECKLSSYTAASLSEAVTAWNTRPAPQSEWRPEVKAFADAMEARLRANDKRDGWKECDASWLIDRIYANIEDIKADLKNKTLHHLGQSCADIGNFAMMLADNEGRLPKLTPTAPTVDDENGGKG